MSKETILVMNLGSTSSKIAVYDDDGIVMRVLRADERFFAAAGDDPYISVIDGVEVVIIIGYIRCREFVINRSGCYICNCIKTALYRLRSAPLRTVKIRTHYTVPACDT